MTEASEKAVVLLSAGLDSTVAMADWLAQGHTVVKALTMDYGQRAARREIEAASQIAAHYGVPHQIIDLPWLDDLLPPALHRDKQSSQAGAPQEHMSVERVWVPNRNGVLLNIAASFAEALKAGTVLFGANAEEGASFPDNTEAYRFALTQALSFSTLNHVQVAAPLVHLDKQAILRRGVTLAVPLQQVWSCYENGPTQCGQCPSCIRVRDAQAQLGDDILIPFS